MKDFFLKTAYLLGKKSKCVSKQVGAVITHEGRIISTGYNGTPAGTQNCNEHFPNYHNALQREEHHAWSRINEIHGEMNAIMFAARHGVSTEGAEIYTILQPCDECLKNIIAAGIKKIYYVVPYDKASQDNPLWKKIEYEQVIDWKLLEWIGIQENFNKQ